MQSLTAVGFESTAVFHFNGYNLSLSKINKRKIRVVTQIDHK